MPVTPAPKTGIDRAIHAAEARVTGGLSPAALSFAYLDWLVHLANSPGKLAELFIVEGDPLADIRNARHVRWVVRAGRVHDAGEAEEGGEGDGQHVDDRHGDEDSPVAVADAVVDADLGEQRSGLERQRLDHDQREGADERPLERR